VAVVDQWNTPLLGQLGTDRQGREVVCVDDVRVMTARLHQGRPLPRGQTTTDMLGQHQPPASSLDDVQLTAAAVRCRRYADAGHRNTLRGNEIGWHRTPDDVHRPARLDKGSRLPQHPGVGADPGPNQHQHAADQPAASCDLATV